MPDEIPDQIQLLIETVDDLMVTVIGLRTMLLEKKVCTTEEMNAGHQQARLALEAAHSASEKVRRFDDFAKHPKQAGVG